jgi:squalene-hopene/tetraprenyl-beta-curcumene cyclase
LGNTDRVRITEAAGAGANWLLALQNSDGGWPTFCRGWGKLPFDRSGADLTAHVLRALYAWRQEPAINAKKARAACSRGLRYLVRNQRGDGSWTPLWFGNQDHPREENPVYGTAKVVMAYRDLGMLGGEPARRAMRWLTAAQNEDGGWGSAGATNRNGGTSGRSSVEETAVAVESLLAAGDDESLQPVIEKGFQWMLERIESPAPLENAPIGFYFAKLWYYEKLYPLIFALSALGRALRQFPPSSQLRPATADLRHP